MCRVNERAYIRADGSRSVFQDEYMCKTGRQRGRLCPDAKVHRTEYHVASSSRSSGPLVQNRQRRSSTSSQTRSSESIAGISPGFGIEFSSRRDRPQISYPAPVTTSQLSRSSRTASSRLDRESAVSVQTFYTAPSNTASYATALSRASAVSNESPSFESLVNNIMVALDTSSRSEPSQDIRATIRTKLFTLKDTSWDTSTSAKDVIMDLVSRIEQVCSSSDATLDKKTFVEDVEQHIVRYRAEQPFLQETLRKSLSAYETFGSKWLQLLKGHSLMLDPKEALDWSGRGQHVEYTLEEQEHIPLVAKGNLGFGASGIVDRVRCRRIDLARKTIRCIRPLTTEEAAKEVRHLQQLQHRHVVRLVGTYMLKKHLSILMYPATEHSLDGFLDHVHDCLHASYDTRSFWVACCIQLFACLVDAIAFIHAGNTKHMDIKPNNILVDYYSTINVAKVYITDFGIARSYQSKEESFTDSPISYTRIYTAPEVAQQATRGPPADIFSLGCVFMEILATLLCTEGNCQQERLRQVRSSNTENSYQANIENVVGWYEGQKNSAAARLLRTTLVKQYYLELDSEFKWDYLLPMMLSVCKWEYLLPMMLSVFPERRPSAAELKEHTSYFACGSCDDGPEPFKAAT